MRKPREIEENAQYHVTARINRREHLLEEEKIKELFLKVLERAKKKYAFNIINFSIMDNHIHLLMEPSKEVGLSKIMQWVLSVFAKAYNKMMKITGHVWYDRFKSKIIRSVKQMIDTFKYINENPVVAGIVKKASDFLYNGIVFIKRGDFSIIDPPIDYLVNLF